MIQGCKSGRLIVDVKLPRHHNRKYETEREGGKGQDYKFSSFRKPKRTEVENNPQPHPVRGKLIKSPVTNRMPFAETTLNEGLCPIRAEL